VYCNTKQRHTTYDSIYSFKTPPPHTMGYISAILTGVYSVATQRCCNIIPGPLHFVWKGLSPGARLATGRLPPPVVQISNCKPLISSPAQIWSLYSIYDSWLFENAISVIGLILRWYTVKPGVSIGGAWVAWYSVSTTSYSRWGRRNSSKYYH